MQKTRKDDYGLIEKSFSAAPNTPIIDDNMANYEEIVDKLKPVVEQIANTVVFSQGSPPEEVTQTTINNIYNYITNIVNYFNQHKVKRAITTEAAADSTNITCNLYDDNGVEITSGTGSAIEVYCSVIGGGNLEDAVPRLEENDDLFIVELPYSSTATRYYCVSLFQASQDCT